MSVFGKEYRITTFGESHSKGVGCVVEGMPSNFSIDFHMLSRRRPGQSVITTQRQELDKVTILCGTNQNGITLGSPLCMLVHNEDMRPGDYDQFANIPRPGHADLTYQQKYSIRAESGGGRSSARETVGRVCAGALAQQFLKQKLGVTFSAWVSSVGEVQIPKEVQQQLLFHPPSQQEIDQNAIRNPHKESAEEMTKLIGKVKEEKDSIGGVVTCCISGCPPGLGEPCFDKLQAVLAHAIMSIPATKGFEFGSGFEGTKMRGSQHNDRLVNLRPISNNAGGTLGGISNGENIYFKVAFKPASTIGLEQETSNFDGEQVMLEAKGRHDPCVVARAVPIVESMAALPSDELVIVCGQVTECKNQNEKSFIISICDGSGVVEIWWDEEIEVGMFIEVVGRFQLRQVKDRIWNKLYVTRLRVMSNSNNYMICLLETLAEYRQAPQIQESFVEKQKQKILLIPKIPVDKITDIMVRFYKRIGNCYFNQEDYPESIVVGELENSSKAIKILNSVKLLNGELYNLENGIELLKMIEQFVKQEQKVTIQQCTQFINRHFEIYDAILFNDELSMCIFNLMLAHHRAFEIALEIALKSHDVLLKVIPILKHITNAIPFPEKYFMINDPQIVKYLLQLYPLMQDSIDMILLELLEVFKDSQEWIHGVSKAIEELAVMNVKHRPQLFNSKMYALDYFEQVLLIAAENTEFIDELCHVFVTFLKYAESEPMVLRVMQKIENTKLNLNYKLQSVNQLDQLVEETVLQLYQEEVQKNNEECHFKSTAIQFQELKRTKKPKSPELPFSMMSLSESFIEPQPSDLLNLEEILYQDRPRLEFEQAEALKSVDTLSQLVLFITDPLAEQPSLLFENDSLAENDFTIDAQNYRKFRHSIKLDKLFTLRSYKTLVFLSDLHNHQLLVDSNAHFLQIVFRCISNFFTNQSSYCNLTHLAALLQFYLKYETKETIYYLLYFNIIFNLINFLYNSYIFDFILRILDPQFNELEDTLKQFIWIFLQKENFIQYLVKRICNQDYTTTANKEFQVSKEGLNTLKLIYDMKVNQQILQVNYGASNQLDQIIGPLSAGKDYQTNVPYIRRSILKKKSQILQRRQTDIGSAKQLRNPQQPEYIFISELQSDGKDIDNIKKDVIEYTILQSEQSPLKKQIDQKAASPVHSPRSPIRKIDRFLTSNTKLPIAQELKLPQIKPTHKSTQSLATPPTSMQNSMIDAIKEKKSIFYIEEIQHTFRSLNPLISPTSSCKSFLFYPNSDNNIIDMMMKDQQQQYIMENNEQTANHVAYLLKHINISMQQCKSKKLLSTYYDCILDEDLQNLDKLLNHFTLRIIELTDKLDTHNSAYQCSYIIYQLFCQLDNNMMEQQFKLLKNYLPKICRNLVHLHLEGRVKMLKLQQGEQFQQLTSTKLMMMKCLTQMICNVKQKNPLLFLKYNETTQHIVNLTFFNHMTNVFYHQAYYQLLRHLFIYASDKQLTSLLFKVNLIDQLSNAYQSAIINKVRVTDWNTNDFLLYLALISQLIINSLEFREDMASLRLAAQRLICFEKLKELMALYNKRLPQQFQQIEKEFLTQLAHSSQKLTKQGTKKIM